MNAYAKLFYNDLISKMFNNMQILLYIFLYIAVAVNLSVTQRGEKTNRRERERPAVDHGALG